MKTLIAICLICISGFVQATSTPRIVTLGGAVTEIAYALGVGSQLVGSDTTSYFPSQAEQLPKVGYLRALSAEGILSLDPHLVLVSSEAGPAAVLDQIKSAQVRVIRLPASRSLADIRSTITRMGKVLQRQAEAQALTSKIDAQSDTLTAVIANRPKHKVLFILQHGTSSPQIAGYGTAAHSIISLSGGTNVAGHIQGYKPLSAEAAIALNPDVIVTTTRGLVQAGGKDALLQSPGLAMTTAARRGQLIAMDALLLLGFGPRTVQAALALHHSYPTHD